MHGGAESTRALAVQCVEHGIHGLWMDAELMKMLIAMTACDVPRQRDAAHLLGVLTQSDDAQVADALMQLLESQDEIVRQRAAMSLGHVDRATNSVAALESLCQLAFKDWNHDFIQAALESASLLAECHPDLAIDTLMKFVDYDDPKIRAASVEGLLNMSPALTFKINIEEKRLVEIRARVGANQKMFESVAAELQVKQDATREVANLVHKRHQELQKWTQTIASHPAVNQCRRHFQTEAFLRDSLDLLKNLLAALRFIETKANLVYSSDPLSDIYRCKQTETLEKLAAFQQNPEAHESMHGMLRYAF